MKFNEVIFKIEVNFEIYEVRVDGELLICEFVFVLLMV